VVDDSGGRRRESGRNRIEGTEGIRGNARERERTGEGV
jgi:hypothetical protein